MNILIMIYEQTIVYLPLIVGAYISFSLLKVPDLSIESAYVSGGILGVLAVNANFLGSTTYAIIPLICALVGGSLVGAVSSTLTTRAGIAHLLSSIITTGIFHGINQFLLPSSYQSISINPLAIFSIFPAYPELIMLTIISIFVLGVIFFIFRTQLGYCLAIYGNNPHFFSHYKISGNYIFSIGISISNALAGLSGYLVAQNNGFIDLNMGTGLALLAITTLVISRSIVKNSRLNIAIPTIGIGIYMILQQILIKIGFNLKYFTMIQSLVVLGFLLFLFSSDPKKAHDHLGI